MIGSARRRLGLGALTAVLALAGCSAGADDPQTVTITSTTSVVRTVAPDGTAVTGSGGFVTAGGRDLVVDGSPFRFVGVNIYDAASSERYSCNVGKRMSDAELLRTMTYLRDNAGVTVVRFWAYQTYTQGGTYWDGIDRVVAAAKLTGLKVLPVLEDGPGNCTNTDQAVPKSQYEGDTWFSQGYQVPYGNATLSFRDYATLVAAHYADEPTILGWSMINEADTSARDADGESVLVDFGRDIATAIRTVDEHHLISVGTQSNGAPGGSGPDFTAVYGLPEIGFAEVHDWGYWGSDTSPMFGGDGAAPPAADAPACTALDAPIGCSFALAAQLDKPLIVGEAGIQATDGDERTRRAGLLRAKMDAAYAAGAAGYLIWGVTTGPTDGYDLLVADDDPLVDEMKQVADTLK